MVGFWRTKSRYAQKIRSHCQSLLKSALENGNAMAKVTGLVSLCSMLPMDPRLYLPARATRGKGYKKWPHATGVEQKARNIKRLPGLSYLATVSPSPCRGISMRGSCKPQGTTRRLLLSCSKCSDSRGWVYGCRRCLGSRKGAVWLRASPADAGTVPRGLFCRFHLWA